jgi:hypothetical protein
MRVGPDIKAEWGAVVRCAKPATYLYFWNGRVWWNDPDCLMLREPLTIDNGRAWASWIALSGQMNLVSEWLPGLPGERLEIYKRTIPNHAKLTARPADLFEREMPRIWSVTQGDGYDRVDIVGFFNWNFPDRRAGRGGDSGAMEEPTTQEAQAAKRGEVGPIKIQLNPDQLGIPGGGNVELVGFDYWDNTFIEPFRGLKEYELKPGSCKVIALHRQLDHPQVLSTSRHITQGLVDLTDQKWDKAKRTLSGRSKVVGDDPYELRIDTAGAQVEGVALVGDAEKTGHAVPKLEGRNLRVMINSPQTREVAWEIRFSPAR